MSRVEPPLESPEALLENVRFLSGYRRGESISQPCLEALRPLEFGAGVQRHQRLGVSTEAARRGGAQGTPERMFGHRLPVVGNHGGTRCSDRTPQVSSA